MFQPLSLFSVSIMWCTAAVTTSLITFLMFKMLDAEIDEWYLEAKEMLMDSHEFTIASHFHHTGRWPRNAYPPRQCVCPLMPSTACPAGPPGPPGFPGTPGQPSFPTGFQIQSSGYRTPAAQPYQNVQQQKGYSTRRRRRNAEIQLHRYAVPQPAFRNAFQQQLPVQQVQQMQQQQYQQPVQQQLIQVRPLPQPGAGCVNTFQQSIYQQTTTKTACGCTGTGTTQQQQQQLQPPPRPGPAGPPGPPGEPGFSPAVAVQGAPGTPGAPGDAGPPGPRGPPGAPEVVPYHSQRVSYRYIYGPGIPGKPGRSGAKGAHGASGTPGRPGQQGGSGDEGCPGHPGRRGKDGYKGQQGPRGPNGVPGRCSCPSPNYATVSSFGTPGYGSGPAPPPYSSVQQPQQQLLPTIYTAPSLGYGEATPAYRGPEVQPSGYSSPPPNQSAGFENNYGQQSNSDRGYGSSGQTDPYGSGSGSPNPGYGSAVQASIVPAPNYGTRSGLDSGSRAPNRYGTDPAPFRPYHEGRGPRTMGTRTVVTSRDNSPMVVLFNGVVRLL